MQIREHTDYGWRTIILEPRTLIRDIPATWIHSRTGQEIADTTLEAGNTIYVRPGELTLESQPSFWEPGDPPARDYIYDAEGMLMRIFFEDRDALALA